MSDSPGEEAAPPPPREGRLRALVAQVRRLLPFLRPYLPAYVAVLILTALGAGAEGGQAALLQPLLNRVLLRSEDSAREEADQAAAADLRRAAGLAEETSPPPTPGAGSAAWLARSGELLPFAGRTRPEPWREDAVCGLLERSRLRLLDALQGLEEAGEPAPEAVQALGEGIRLQVQAQEAVLPDPLAASPVARAEAAAASLQARAAVRQATFLLAWSTLGWILGVAMGMAAVLGLSRYGSGVIARLVLARVARDLQVALMGHVLTLSVSQLKDERRGDLLTRLTTDLDRSVNGVLLPLLEDVVVQPIRLVVLLTIAFWIYWPLAVCLMVLALSVLYPIGRWGRLIRQSARKRQDALAEVLEAIHQIFSGLRVVKAFRREPYERERFQRLTDRAYQAEVAVTRARVASRTWLRLANDVTVPIVVLGGGWLILHRVLGLDAGRFVAFVALIVFMYRPIRDLGMAYNTLQDSVHSLRRLTEVFERQPALLARTDGRPMTPIKEGIRAEGLCFNYDGGGEVLKDVSWFAPAGTTVAIVGKTGSGKSTLMDLLVRFADPTGGRLTVDGVPLTELDLSGWRSRLALVSQQPFLFNDTIRENLRYGRPEASQEEIEAAARAAGIHDEIVARPEGYEWVVGELGSRLSGGQRQRVTIARALLRRPEVLLLDEATSALDTRTEHLVQQALDSLKGRCTVFVIAHRLSTVRHADQILVLDGGRLVDQGRHEELQARGGVYAELLHQLAVEEGDPAAAGGA